MVIILETTKTETLTQEERKWFYRSQFWRLQKLSDWKEETDGRFIDHNFGDYKNPSKKHLAWQSVLSITILETTKTYWLFQRSRS